MRNQSTILKQSLGCILGGSLLLSCTEPADTQAAKTAQAAPPQATQTGYAPIGVAMELKKITDDIYYVEGEPGMATDNEGFISNAGFVVTGDGVIVFDALGTPSLAHNMVQLIRSVTDQPIKRVYTSHYHADHIYGLQVLEELGAKIYAPEGAYVYIESPNAKERLEERQFSLDPWVNENTRVVLPDVIVQESDKFTMGDKTITINYQGKAHSDGDLSMLVEPDRVLFSGDVIFEGRIPFVGNADTKRWLDTLRKLETGGLVALIPGHGPASFQPADTIKLTRRYLEHMRQTMADGVDELMSFDQIYSSADWSEFEDLPAFEAGNRINAYQVFLSLEAELLKQ